MSRRLVTNLVALATLTLSPLAQASEVPHYVNFQSVLRDDGGNIIEDSFIDLQIKILDQDKDIVYEETQPGVQVVRGAINVMIGEGIEPGSSPSVPTGGIPLTAINPANGTHFLQVQYGSNLPSGDMELGSVPYAMYAEVALGLAPDIPSSAIPGNFVTEEELAAAILAHESDTTAHPAGSITAVDNFQNSNSSNVQTVLENLDAAIEAEEAARATADSGLQTQIDGKVNRSGDTMAGTLNMGGNNITNVGSSAGVGFALADHESRISALEGGSSLDQNVHDFSMTFNIAPGGVSIGGSDASDWSVCNGTCSTGNQNWVYSDRTPIAVPAGCVAMASGTIGANPVAFETNDDSFNADDDGFLDISYSNTQTVNVRASAIGDDGRFVVTLRVIAIPTSSSADCRVLNWSF